MLKTSYRLLINTDATLGLGVHYDHITTDAQLEKLCCKLASSSFIGFDTEFVSEDTYFPELCLIQVAADEVLAVIDPQEIGDMTLFWDALSKGEHLTIAHAAREEFRFCRTAVQRRPANLFDVQLAAGLVGIEYPASYGKLLNKLLNVRLAKGETRTDWRRRPLSDKQIEYALQDVIYLKDIHTKIEAKLVELGRLEWLQEEMSVWQDQMEAAEQQERWRRVSGISGLPEKALVIVRELWRWREGIARSKNRPPRRILRDDLIVELARRGKIGRQTDPRDPRLGPERCEASNPHAFQRHCSGIGTTEIRMAQTVSSETVPTSNVARPVHFNGSFQHLPLATTRSQHRRHSPGCPRPRNVSSIL